MRKWLAEPLPKIPKMPRTILADAGQSDFGDIGHFGQPPRKQKFDPDAFEERAAIVQYEAAVPREWAEGFARLNCSAPPNDISATRWQQIVDDGGRFLDRWGGHAAALGWDAASVFGRAGLVVHIDGGAVTAIAAMTATIRPRAGSVLVYRRREEVGAVPLWVQQ